MQTNFKSKNKKATSRVLFGINESKTEIKSTKFPGNDKPLCVKTFPLRLIRKKGQNKTF